MSLDVRPDVTGTVLIVEDEVALRQLLVEALTECGHRVLEAGSGTSAKTLIESCAGTLDVLVTDVRMPGLSGPQIAAAARSMVPQLKVVYMSGYTDPSGLQAELADGRADFIQKPFGTELLCERIAGLLRAERH